MASLGEQNRQMSVPPPKDTSVNRPPDPTVPAATIQSGGPGPANNGVVSGGPGFYGSGPKSGGA